MWPVSDRFLAAVRQSHEVVVKADLFIGDTFAQTIFPVDGTVDMDSRRATRRNLRMQVVDEDGTLTPGQSGTTGLLTPFGAELRVYRGIRYSDGSEEFAPLGVFVITEVTVSEDSGGTRIEVAASDRSVIIDRNKFLDPFQIAAGVSVESAIAAILLNRWADVEIDLPTTGFTVNAIVLETGDEPWKKAVEIASASGYNLAFDADGVVRMRVTPDPLEDDAVQTYEDGEAAVVTQLSRKFESARSFNGVIVTVESTGISQPFRVLAWDDNPDSPTYRFGPYGQVPFFYTNEVITTQAQATQVAVNFLRRFIGQAEAIEWEQVVNPAHDCFDVIRIRRGVLDYAVVLDRVTVPLGADQGMRSIARVWSVNG